MSHLTASPPISTTRAKCATCGRALLDIPEGTLIRVCVHGTSREPSTGVLLVTRCDPRHGCGTWNDIAVQAAA